jgi:hypothetical protein
MAVLCLQTTFEAIKAMRGSGGDTRKAIELLLGMKRDDISDELCSHFRATVHAMTTAMEPGAGEDAKASLRREACSFQELVDQQAVRGSDDVETPGDVPAGADPNVYIKRSSIQGAGGGAFARQQLLAQTELLPHAGFPVSAATLRAGGYPGGYVMRVGAPYIDARDPEGSLVLADGRTVSTHEFTDAEWELLSPVGVRWDGAANLSRFINEASGDAEANVSFSKGRWRTTREVGEHEELLVATYGKDFWRGEEEEGGVDDEEGEEEGEEDDGDEGEEVPLAATQLDRTVRHSPTGLEVSFTEAEMRATEASAEMVAHVERVAAEHAPQQTLSELVQAIDPTTERAAAAAAVARLLEHKSLVADGVRWKRHGPRGNELTVRGVTMLAYGTYRFSAAKKHSTARQLNNTLMITRAGFEALVAARDALAAQGLGVHNMPTDRPAACFVIGAVYLLEEMQREAGGAPFVDGHNVNSADPHAAFAWHPDDHAEQEGGPYIETSLVCQCSEGETSMSIAGVGEKRYPGVGGIVRFPAWALHRTAHVEPTGAAMWKLAGFFGQASRATAPQTDPELSLDGLEQYRVKNGLDIWVVPPDAAAAMLGISVAEQQQCWTELSQHPMRNRSDAIVPCEPQWINGDNEALEMYRHGTRTKRDKMWFQTDDPLAEGFLVYKYTYHQQLVVPATFDVANCPSLARITSAYNSKICHALGAKEANHGIATAYENGTDCITAHSDKASDIAPSDRGGLSLIGVLKAGENSRPFEIAMDKQSAPFFTKELPPGTLVLMTLEANNRTVHSVPAVPDCGPSGSIVWRTITTRMTTAEVVRELEMRGHGGEKEARPAAIAAYSAAAQALGSMIEPEVVD